MKISSSSCGFYDAIRHVVPLCTMLWAVPVAEAFNLKNPFRDPMAGGSVIKIGASFRCPSRGPQTVIGTLDKLARNADCSTAEGFAELAGGAALLMLRQNQHWLSCGGSVKHYGDDDQALSRYDREVITEAAKFEANRSAHT